jgi:hypothetical protein
MFRLFHKFESNLKTQVDLPRPLEATSVAMRMGALPERNSNWGNKTF